MSMFICVIFPGFRSYRTRNITNYRNYLWLPLQECRALRVEEIFIGGRTIRAMPDILRSLDPRSDRVIFLAGESICNHCYIFYLPQTFPRLKIKASRKSIPYISVQPFDGAERSGAFLHSQRPEPQRYPH
jgi:hypothetical protein